MLTALKFPSQRYSRSGHLTNNYCSVPRFPSRKVSFRLGTQNQLNRNKPFPSSPGPLYQNEVKCSAFDTEMIFHSHANKPHLHKKGYALGLILKVRVFGTRKWPISWIVIIKRRSPFPSSSASWRDDWARVSFTLCSHYSGQLFVQTRKAVGYGMNTYPIIYVTLHFSELEIGAA